MQQQCDAGYLHSFFLRHDVFLNRDPNNHTPAIRTPRPLGAGEQQGF